MKEITTTTLTLLILIPIFWNVAGLLHYMVEHTHTFCINIEDHNHTPVHDCQDICHQYDQSQKDAPVTQRIEFQEIKNYISSVLIYLIPLHISDSGNKFCCNKFCNQDFIKEIFHPPASC